MEQNNTIIWSDRKHHLWFPISFTKYYISNERLMIKQGFLNTTLDELLLYRIVDLTCHQTLLGKIFGTGDVIIKSKVDTSPELTLKNIARPFNVRMLLSEMVEESRRRRNVVGKEFYSGGPRPDHAPDHMHTDLDGDGICDLEDMHDED